LKPETKHYAFTLSYATKNVKVLENSMGSHVPTFGHDIVVVASGARAHERCMLSRDIATALRNWLPRFWSRGLLMAGQQR
jgi:hypothetical protein